MDTAVVETPSTSTTTTPAPTSSTPASAPVSSTTQTTPSTPATVQRPGNVTQLAALMRNLDSGATPIESVTAKGIPAATAPGVIDPKPGEAQPQIPQGPIPFETHKQILENARAKAVEEFKASHWSSKIPEQSLQEFAGIAQKMSANPISFVTEFLDQLDAHPIYGPQLRAMTAEQSAAPQAAPEKPSPDVEIRNEQGQVVGMSYSAPQMEKLLAFQQAEWTKGVDARLQPVISAEQQRQEYAQQQETSRQLNAAADSRMARMARMLDIPKGDLKHPHWQTVATVWQQHPDWEPEDVALEVRATAIQPGAEQRARDQVAEDMRRKAAGNTANGHSPVTTITKPKNVQELAAYLRELDGAS